MKLSEFEIGKPFWHTVLWVCTDKGKHNVLAVQADVMNHPMLIKGPPYPSFVLGAQVIFNEETFPSCTLESPTRSSPTRPR